MAKKSRTLVVLIGIFKLVKGTALLAAAIGLFDLVGKDAESTMRRWLADIGLDPDHGSLHSMIGKLGGFSIGQLALLTAGTLIYAALFFIEGIGLLRGKRWAEYLTIVITISFIPFEIYELVHEVSVMKIAALVVNIAIATYLIARVIREQS
jgi:uncharacterized membrane protein (DUF2068 family)